MVLQNKPQSSSVDGDGNTTVLVRDSPGASIQETCTSPATQASPARNTPASTHGPRSGSAGSVDSARKVSSAVNTYGRLGHRGRPTNTVHSPASTTPGRYPRVALCSAITTVSLLPPLQPRSAPSGPSKPTSVMLRSPASPLVSTWENASSATPAGTSNGRNTKLPGGNGSVISLVSTRSWASADETKTTKSTATPGTNDRACTQHKCWQAPDVQES